MRGWKQWLENRYTGRWRSFRVGRTVETALHVDCQPDERVPWPQRRRIVVLKRELHDQPPAASVAGPPTTAAVGRVDGYPEVLEVKLDEAIDRLQAVKVGLGRAAERNVSEGGTHKRHTARLFALIEGFEDRDETFHGELSLAVGHVGRRSLLAAGADRRDLGRVVGSRRR